MGLLILVIISTDAESKLCVGRVLIGVALRDLTVEQLLLHITLKNSIASSVDEWIYSHAEYGECAE